MKKPRRTRRPRHERARAFRPFTPEQLAERAAAIPLITYPDLPVSARREEIAEAIRDHQVVIVSGETGSGKTTQLPKICMQLGRGVTGMIGHTQPRRIAARSVADRIAEELGQKVGREAGQVVGYQVRFTDEVGPTTLVKLMTDGILLAEIQADPLLRRYDTLIIDEAHERSLNIDFILGYLARLLPARPDLKVIITSATIDSARFAEHFGRWEGTPGRGPLLEPAPVIEVSGRTFPVEIRYRPLAPDVVSTYSTSTPGDKDAGDNGTGTSGLPAEMLAPGVPGRARSGFEPRGEGSEASGRAGAGNGSAPESPCSPDAPAPAPGDHPGSEQLVLEDPDDELPSLGYGLGEEIDVETAICEAVDELCAEGEGDILVFLPGERDIRDTEQALLDHLGPRGVRAGETKGARPNDVEIVPLFARLSAAEQHRVFEEHRLRRVVLATNVAETSLTVPGIRYVIDPGFARISRYSNRTKVQRLPIEPVSQASANQRAGRCGRVADGIAIRLYSQRDYEGRPRYTEPEILRTSLASVILQMAALGLGSVEDFPFLDAPERRAVRDGIAALVEIGALAADEGGRGMDHRLTRIGRELARLPIDPRLGRILLEGDANGCASEVLVIVAALSIQDVRERPLDHQQAADAAHARFSDPRSDFITYLNLWRYLEVQSRDLSGSQFRRMCRAEFLHYLRYREWRDVVVQLRQMARPLDLDVHPIDLPTPGDVIEAAQSGGVKDAAARAAVAFTASSRTVDADEIHRSILVGLLSNLGSWDEAKREYRGARGTRFTIWPGSGLSRSHPAWVMTAELVETSRLFARTVARIDPAWIEPLAGPLLTRVYSEPFWSSAKGAAMVKEKVLLYGLTISADRPVLLGRLGERVIDE
ncbi:oligonucleotide/oligosaccharide-binding fold domain-containing protein, partial [Schaalia hyovaginalis]|uniref:oligonucleotide/oligosaccharide-binding fold domain-containing protein n=1 Tax=Schaalia hyovaginalis TaxID=29316 RepID=UPI0026F2C6B1